MTMTSAEYLSWRFKQGRWRIARVEHECRNSWGAGYDRKGCLGTGRIEARSQYFDTQDPEMEPFKMSKLCEACANATSPRQPEGATA